MEMHNPPVAGSPGKLREFSDQLAEKLKSAPATVSDQMRLAIRIGPKAYMLEMAAAGEIVPFSEIASVPWTKPWFRGLANVRGQLVGVIDLQQFSGMPPLPPEQAQQLLVIGPSVKVNAALLITRAFGLRNLQELDALETITDGSRPWEVGRYRDLDGTVLTALDLARLVSSEGFFAVGM